ncbi:hypothetical protein KNO81_42085 [Paraburkholderia sediminicola]|jgi:hypothetical protein|nr:hypothetical protein [Paraburkholderia sediminicola]
MPPLPESQLERIKRVFAARRQMRPVSVVPRNSWQAEAMGTQVFELQKTGANHYQLLRTNLVTRTVPPLHGEFIFVILPEDPGRIYRSPDSPFSRFGIDGHCSLTAWQDVLFAGMLDFDDGRLRYWNNFSGHYRPGPALRYVNLIPAVRLLLPESLYGCSDIIW